jgi:glycerate 2-kinase
MVSNHERLSDIFYAALQAVDPYKSTSLYTDKIRFIFQSGQYKRLIVIGFGKASCPMAKSIKDQLSDSIVSGIIITKYGHCQPPYKPKKIQIYEAGHPVPDENGVRGTDEIIRLFKNAGEPTLIVCLISGGGSALLVSPFDGISLNEKRDITQLLLQRGADIFELNAVRKHISKVKGGRLAEIAYPAKVLSLILSDVIGDRLDIIASGPTSPDKNTYRDAFSVIEKYGITDTAPYPIIKTIQNGMKGLLPETPKEGNMIFENVENLIIGSNKKALEAAREKAEEPGFDTIIISSDITGEAKEVGKWLAKKAIEVKNKKSSGHSVCLISGGETTVTVKGNGLGGRNMELALSFAMEIKGINGIILLSAGTDGTDGPTDAAGAIVDGKTVLKAKNLGINPEAYLMNNDSYNFFKKIDELFITGPTGTNVMDIQIIVIE